MFSLSLPRFAVSLALCGAFFFTTAVAVTRGATVNVRIEGASASIFEGLVFTRGRNISTVAGGLHVCDGTNDASNPLPGPTVTTALADAAKLANFTWNGAYAQSYNDFFITNIGTGAASTQDWGVLVNYTFIPSTGCRQIVTSHDNILFADDAFSAEHFLELSASGPTTVAANTPVSLVVRDGMSGDVISGATVSEKDGGVNTVSDFNGLTTVTFTTPGQYSFKASRDDSIRSNAVAVIVSA